MSQRVTIVGPNLPSSLQRLGDFHIHAEGCADLKRGAIRRHAEQGWTINAACLTDIADDVFADIIDECDGDPADYLGEFHFAPCVNLPTAL